MTFRERGKTFADKAFKENEKVCANAYNGTDGGRAVLENADPFFDEIICEQPLKHHALNEFQKI